MHREGPEMTPHIRWPLWDEMLNKRYLTWQKIAYEIPVEQSRVGQGCRPREDRAEPGLESGAMLERYPDPDPVEPAPG